MSISRFFQKLHCLLVGEILFKARRPVKIEQYSFGRITKRQNAQSLGSQLFVQFTDLLHRLLPVCIGAGKKITRLDSRQSRGSELYEDFF